MTSNRLIVGVLVGALLCAPTIVLSADGRLADEDVLEYYGEHIQDLPSGIYAQRGWVFFQQRVPIAGSDLFAEQRALGRALGNVRRDVFVAVNNLAAKIPLPSGPSYVRVGNWARRLNELQRVQSVTNLPSKCVAQTEDGDDYVYSLAVDEAVLRQEAERPEFATKAADVAGAWRALCAEESQKNDARSVVKETLSRSNVKVGIDYAKKRWVFIGSSECDMEEPANDSEFLKKRRECAVRAEMEARRALVKARGEVVSAKDSARMVGVGDAAGISIASYSEILAKESLSGVLVLTTAESWDPSKKRYQVAVAVAWSEKLAAAEKVVDVNRQAFREDGGEDPEWAKWAKTQDFSKLFGTRSFKDSNGVRRFVGLGFSEIEGKSGPALRMAQRKAQMDAAQNLAAFVNFDLASKEVLASLVQSVAAGTLTESAAWEKYRSSVLAKCREIPLRAHEVYRMDVKHPLTGHLMHVSVYGLSVEGRDTQR